MVVELPVPSPADSEPELSEPGAAPPARPPYSKFLRRLPVMLYRLGFGPLLGIMPLLILTTRGHSGRMRYTPLEYRRHGSRIYVLATARDAQWLNRVYDDAAVTIRMGLRAFPAAAEIVTDDAEAVRALFLFRMNAPVPLRWVYWSGRNRSIVHPQNFKQAARRYTFVRLERLSGRSMIVPAVPADRAWMPGLALIALILLAILSRKKSA